MAYFVDPLIVNFETDADLSASAYRPVRLSSGKLVLATGTGSSILGALTDDVEDGSSDTVSVPVALAGVAKVQVGTGGATEMSFGTGAANGWTDAAATQYYGCLFLEDGSVGEIVSAVIVQGQLD
jgi:hypothetical protein